jgi:hypothetical protein
MVEITVDGGHDGTEPSIKAGHLTAEGVQPDCFASSVHGMNFVEAVSAFKPDHMNRPGNTMDEAVRISQSRYTAGLGTDDFLCAPQLP